MGEGHAPKLAHWKGEYRQTQGAFAPTTPKIHKRTLSTTTLQQKDKAEPDEQNIQQRHPAPLPGDPIRHIVLRLGHCLCLVHDMPPERGLWIVASDSEEL